MQETMVTSAWTTYASLVSIFGSPNVVGPDVQRGKDSSCEWEVRVKGVTLFIYDRRTYGETPREFYDWNVQGPTPDCLEMADIEEAMKCKIYLR